MEYGRWRNKSPNRIVWIFIEESTLSTTSQLILSLHLLFITDLERPKITVPCKQSQNFFSGKVGQQFAQ